MCFLHSIFRLAGSCFNHLRNVWIGAIEILQSRKVTHILVEDLALIPQHLRVKCDIGNVCRSVDKEFAFTANYAKGHGHAFHDWMRRYHPGELMMSVHLVATSKTHLLKELSQFTWVVNSLCSGCMRSCVQAQRRTSSKQICLSYYVQPR